VELMHRLYEESLPLAAATTVASLTVGLGYTAVTTSAGDLGLSYTWIEGRERRTHADGYHDVEDECTATLLERLLSDDPFQRSIGLATANALHQGSARALPDDVGAPLGCSLQLLGIGPGTHVSMVGYFPPLARTLPELGVELDVIDSSLGIGDPIAFRARLGSWTEALIVTATTLLNESTEELVGATGPGVRAVMMGPSTPLVPAAFAHLPVMALAGIVPIDTAGVEKVVRHGAATPVMKALVRKVYCLCPHGTAPTGRPA
jgi:uncharacterized protein (DUF4213/DUF364 family)